MRRLLWLVPVALIAAVLTAVFVFPALNAPDVSADWEGRIATATNGGLQLHEPGRRTVLVEPTGTTFVQDAAFTPDGASIAFARTRLPTGAGRQSWSVADIWQVPVDGGEPVLLVEHQTDGEQLLSPQWAGDRLLVASSAPIIEDGRYVDQRNDILLIDPRSGDRELVVENGSQPSASSDGRLVAYLAIDPETFEETVALLDRETGESRTLVDGSSGLTWLRHPTVSPDATQVAFTAGGQARAAAPRPAAWYDWLLPRVAEAHGPPQDIWLVDIASGELTRVTEVFEDEPSIAWPASSDRIAFHGTTGVYLVDPAGGEPALISSEGGYGGIAWWRP